MSRLSLATLRAWRPIPEGGPLKRFIAWYVTSQLIFDSAIWILFLQHRGYSLAEIGLAESVFHLAPILLEIPSGSFADLVGRRWSLAIGSGLTMISAIILWNADSLPFVLLALFISGANYSFRSGADQAYLYDALSDQAKPVYGKILGRLLALGYLSGGLATALGAYLSEWSYGWAYLLSGIVGFIGIILAVGLPETRREHAEEIRRSPRQHALDVRNLLRAQPVVARMLAVVACFWATLTMSGLYAQAAFKDRGLDNGQIGLLIGSSWVMIAIGATWGGQLHAPLRRLWPVLAGGTALGVALVGSGMIVIAMLAFLIREIFAGALEPRLSNWYNDHLPSAQRATVISIESWLFSCLMIVFFPLAGWCADRYGWSPVYLGFGLAGGLMVLLGWRLLGRHVPVVTNPEPASEVAI